MNTHSRAVPCTDTISFPSDIQQYEKIGLQRNLLQRPTFKRMIIRPILDKLCLVISWVLVTALAAALAWSLYFNQVHCREGLWRALEFESVKRDIPLRLHTHEFNIALDYNSSRHLFRPVTSPPYVGAPSERIDKAWKHILAAVNIWISPEELQFFPDSNLFQDPGSGLYMAQVTVTHNLHCLNLIRKSRSPEYYTEMIDSTLDEHINHCIDSLRESIMCTGDMTLIPVRWSENRNWALPDFKTQHTCRNYNVLRDWILDRDAETHERLYQNAERYYRTGTFRSGKQYN